MVRVRTSRPLAVAGFAALAVLFAVTLWLVSSQQRPLGLGLRACKVGGLAARCGTAHVPENPARPSGRKIPLGVVVFPATGPDRKPDPVLWFSGWGGAGASDDAAPMISAWRDVNRTRDIVFIDQRGTGTSKRECRLPDTTAAGALEAAARACAERAGPNLRFYTSAVAVDDVDKVRQALGYRRVNLYGGSYGVTTGQIYLLRHPAHVRTAVFDSGSLLDVRIFERGAANAQRALDLLFARCARDTACATAYPRLRDQFAALQTRPGLDRATLGHALDLLLPTWLGKAQLPRFIHYVVTNRLAEAAKLVPRQEGGSELAYKLLIQCSEPWASWRIDAMTRLGRGSFMQPLQLRSARQMAAACKGLPRAAVPAAIGRRVHSQVPVLFLQGSEDPADPPAAVAHARRELPNSTTVIFPRSGHGQLGLLCAQNLIAGFVERAGGRALDTSCVKTAVRTEFDIRD